MKQTIFATICVAIVYIILFAAGFYRYEIKHINKEIEEKYKGSTND